MTDGPTPVKTATELRAASNRLSRRLRSERPDDELTMSQSVVLGRLDLDGPATASELAAAEHIRPQSMGATLGVLESRELITKGPHPTDGRQVVVSLTDRGRQAVEAARKSKTDWLTHAIAEELSPTEQRLLSMAVELINRITAR